MVLAVSRLVPEKGLEYLIEAVGLLPAPRPNLVVVGTGPLRQRLAQLAAARGVSLHMVGGLQPAEMPPVYASADVFVMPSVTTRTFKEPWGLACNEAMCQALPVVATTAVGAAAGGLVQDGVTGLVVPERDPQALGQAISRLLRDRSFARELGQRGKERVKQTNWEAMVAGFEAAVDYALRKRGATV
ncbi:MAG: glycosyltransferase family 4 protein [Thermoleophilia bacterium]|nr:glycosyltransferase family 4 protein [Thermoleophilia bacterium]